MPPKEYVDKLKRDFAITPQYEGYDADEDIGYFVEWLIAQLYRASFDTLQLKHIYECKKARHQSKSAP